MYSQTQRINPAYANISNMNGQNMNNQYGQYSQMNQYQPQTYYPQQSQFLVPSGYLPNVSNNCTQEIFPPLQTQTMTQSLFQENNTLSFSQMVKNNLEAGLKNLPENFSNCLMDKMNTKLQKSNEEILTFKKKLNESNNRMEKKLENFPNCLRIVENELNEINSKLIKVKELVENNKNYVDYGIKKNQNEFLDRIAFGRENEKRLMEFIDQIDILKMNISDSILYAETELNKNLKLKDESLEEIKLLLSEKFKELSKELSGIKIEKSKIYNFTLSNEVSLDSSVKKINELKTFISKFHKNDRIKEIKKESFCLLAQKENNKNLSNLNSNCEKASVKFHKKGNFRDYSFFDI